ncbi:family 78 glycoside hydrolase catalytic domain, partial [Conexibacter stalactiti]
MRVMEATVRGRWRELCATALTLTALSSAAAVTPGSAFAATAPPQVTGLTTEQLTDPLGLDAARPRLAWKLSSDQRGARQRAYRILVASSPDKLQPGQADVWDSGEVTSAQSFDAVYNGPALTSSTRYHWRVQSFLKGDQTGTWSAPAWFETGLLDAAGWGSASWIGRADPVGAGVPQGAVAVDLAGASWIWHPDAASGVTAPPQPRYFRRAFTIPAGRTVTGAQLAVTADDNGEVWLNGERVGSTTTGNNAWMTAKRYRLAPVEGVNVLAVATTNTPETNGSNSPAGLLARVRVALDDGTFVTADTTSGFKTSTTASADWQQTSFDDSGWSDARQLGTYGMDPWKSRVTVPATAENPASAKTLDFTGANWIWSGGDAVPPTAPPQPRWFRKTFTIPAGRTISSAALIATADDGLDLYLDGERLISSPQVRDAWKTAQRADDLTLSPGDHVLAVTTRNSSESDGSNSPAGLLARLRVDYGDGSVTTVESDASWRGASAAQEGWEQPGFDDSGWSPATALGTYGANPWKTNVTIPPAPWAEPLLRRDFTVARAIRSARLYVAAGGYADLSINGERVNDHVLDPALTAYDQRLSYVTSDVTRLLREGANAIGAQLGRGFFGMQQANVWNWHQAPWNGPARVRALLRIDYADGGSETVPTDDSWRLAAGPTLADSLFAGETYDARRERDGFDAPGFDDSGWEAPSLLRAPGGQLVAQAHEPIRVVETLKPVAITNPAPGVHVLDFGRNVTGWARINVSGPAATKVNLLYSERLRSGRAWIESTYITGELQTDHYTLAGDPDGETWEPRFSYKGFQYVEVTGWPGELTAEDVQARVLHSDLPVIGGFDASNPLLDRIHELTVNTVFNNLHGIPTDTPVYEKNGWTGDAQVLAELTMFNLGSQSLHAKWLDDVSDSRSASGEPAVIAPTPGWGRDKPSPPWNAAYVMIPWWLYQYAGDERVVREHYDGIKKYVDWELGKQSGYLSSTNYGDWVAPDSGGGKPPEDPRVAGTAYVHLMTRTLSQMADLLGRDDDAARYREAAAKMRTAFNATFYDAQRGWYRGDSRDLGVYRQAHNVFALAFGLVPQSAQGRVAASIAADVRARGVHLNTGAMATKHLLPVLTAHGYGELAYQLATQRTAPSWGFWVDNGATSLWEMWTNPRSVGHAFLGTVDDWFWKDVAGLRSTGDGYATFDVRPHLVGDLTEASAFTRTPRGRAAVAWSRGASGAVTLRVTVPVGATARVHVPAQRLADVTEGGEPITRAAGVQVADDAAARAADGAVVLLAGAGDYTFVVGAPVAAGETTVSGPATPGGELVCTAPAFDGAGTATTAYAWTRDGAPIDGAAGARYVVREEDVARRIACVVTATNEAGSGSAASAAVVPVRDGAGTPGPAGPAGPIGPSGPGGAAGGP